MGKLPTLQDSFNAQGVFWLPGSEEVRWQGHLVYDPVNGAIITVFREAQGSEFLDLLRRNYEILNGHLFDYRCEVTLVDCIVNSGETPPFSISYSTFKYHAKQMLLGRLFADKSAIAFRSMSVGYTSLQGWLSRRLPNEWELIEGSFSRVTFPNATQELFRTSIDAIEAEISAEISMQIAPELHKAHIHQNYDIAIEPNSPRPLEFYLNIIQSIRNLIAFLVFLPVQPKVIIGKETESNRIGISVIEATPKPEIDVDHDSKMLMPLSRLGKGVCTVFQKWFEKQEKIEILVDLSIGVLYNAHKFHKFEFLALMQALESYHQVAYPGCKERDEVLSEKCQQEIMRSCSIKTRIKDLVEKLPDSLKEHAQFDEKTLSSIVNSRNYYTHYPERLRNRALIEKELEPINIRLFRLILLILYNEMGISQEKVTDAFNQLSPV